MCELLFHTQKYNQNNRINKLNNMYKVLRNIDFWNTVYGTILGFITSFVLPVGPFIMLSIFLVFADLYSGIRVARKNNVKLTSRGLYRTVEKIGLYLFVILCSRGIEVVFKLPVPVTYMASIAICLTEFKSLIENTTKLTGVVFTDKIKDLINYKKSTDANK